MRLRAIACALWYGILPWWLYERDCHHAGMGYSAHLTMNLRYAWTWLTGKETNEDVEFERRVNGGREVRR